MADGARPETPKINKLGYRILGVLARAPQSGYDIVKALVRFRPVNISQVYPILTEMEAAGLLNSHEVVQSGKPNKKLYDLTPVAEDVLRAWVTSPTEPPEPRDEFVGKVYSLWKIAPDQRVGILHARLEWLRAEVTHFAAQLQALHVEHGDAYSDPDTWQFSRHILISRRLALYWEEIRWCQDVLASLDNTSCAK